MFTIQKSLDGFLTHLVDCQEGNNNMRVSEKDTERSFGQIDRLIQNVDP